MLTASGYSSVVSNKMDFGEAKASNYKMDVFQFFVHLMPVCKHTTLPFWIQATWLLFGTFLAGWLGFHRAGYKYYKLGRYNDPDPPVVGNIQPDPKANFHDPPTMQADTFPSKTGKSDAFALFAHKGACCLCNPDPQQHPSWPSMPISMAVKLFQL